MTERRIDNPITNSPFEMPDRHFRFDDEGSTEDIVDGRRPSAYFTSGPKPYEWLHRALKAEIDPDARATLYSTVSRPFARPITGKIAIKVINHYGDEIVQDYEVA